MEKKTYRANGVDWSSKDGHMLGHNMEQANRPDNYAKQPAQAEPLVLGFDPNNSSIEYLDRLRSEAFARGGESDADFQRYNQIYTERLAEANKATQDAFVAPIKQTTDSAPAIFSASNNIIIDQYKSIVGDKFAESQAKSRVESNSSFDKASDLEDANKGKMREIFERLAQRSKKIGQKVLELFKSHRKEIMTGVSIASIGSVLLTGSGKSTESVVANTNSQPSDQQQTDTGALLTADDKLKEYADLSNTGYESDANLEIGNNNKYDQENDSFYKFDNKESRGSIGTSIETANDDQYIDYLKNNTEDNLSFKGQFFRMNEELAQTLLGVNAEGVEALVDAAEKGDQAAFEKLDKAYDTLMSEAKLSEGQRALGDQFDSIYRVQEADGTWTYKHADDLNIGGTYRTISTVVNGKTYTFDLRDQCTQLILRDIVVEIPAIVPTEYSNFVEPKTPTPINEVPENPENPGENPNEIPENPDDKKLESKDPKVDINANSKLNPEVKSEVKDNTVNTNVGNQYEYKAQDADQNMTYDSSNYAAPPVENFYREDKAENTIADLSQATPQEVIEATPSVDEATGESTLTESQQETGAIVDNSSNTYKVEVSYGDTSEQPATPDVSIDDPNQAGSLNGATNQNGNGSNTERVNGF